MAKISNNIILSTDD